jgi:uracil-DNA glycosylase family 4
VDDALRRELRELTAAARALLEEESARGGAGIPPWSDALAALERVKVVDAHGAHGPAALVTTSASASPKPAPTVEDTPGASVDPSAALAPPPSPEERRIRLAQLALDASTCTRCVLHEKRTQSVFARGHAEAELAFVGEGPGQEEDLQGMPFVGPAGKLLDRMIAAMGYARDEVYVCNVVKCRPPENRTPRAEEAIACSKYLVPQLQAVAPRVIVALGRCAAENLGLAGPVGPWRGRWGSWQGIPVMPTYHPAYLLRSPEQKRVVWEDLQRTMQRLGRQPPPRAGG